MRGGGDSCPAKLEDFIDVLEPSHINVVLEFLKWFVVIFYKYEQKFVFSFAEKP